MQLYFEEIKKRYDLFYKSLLKQGQLPVRTTKHGFWGPSVADEVFSIFNSINLSNFSHFLDMGSGDGKVVLIASLFTKASGVESEKWLVETARAIQKDLLHIPNLSSATFIEKNFFDHDISDYDVIFINPDTPFHRGLENKFMKELNGLLIHYGEQLYLTKLNQEKRFVINGTPIRIYTKP